MLRCTASKAGGTMKLSEIPKSKPRRRFCWSVLVRLIELPNRISKQDNKGKYSE